MKGFRNVFMALILGCLAPLLVLAGAAVALYRWIKVTKLFKKALPDLSCSIDTDCPPGYVCMDGRCVPQV